MGTTRTNLAHVGEGKKKKKKNYQFVELKKDDWLLVVGKKKVEKEKVFSLRPLGKKRKKKGGRAPPKKNLITLGVPGKKKQKN